MSFNYEELEPIPLEITPDNYRGNLHASIGASLAHGMNGKTSFAESDYPDFSPDRIKSETPIREGRATVEDWLMYDGNEDSYILVQGKSYGVDDVERGINQLHEFSTEFRMLQREVYNKLEDLLLVIARPSGVREPRTDFSQVERGIREEIMNGGKVRMIADAYSTEPLPDESLPFDNLH